MNPKAVYKFCKNLGCCEACCVRYIGIKQPNAYENIANFVKKYQDEVDTKPINTNEQEQSTTNSTEMNESKIDVSKNDTQNGNSSDLDSKNVNNSEDSRTPPYKKRRLDICVSCLGILQEGNWMESYILVKDVLFKKRYECKSFACALSAPIATLLRERAITLRLAEEFPGYDDKTLTPLKEAWKWSFGVRLAAEIGKTLDSGAVSPLLITLNHDYADDLQELEILKQVSPQLFEERSKQKRRFVTEFTRRSVEQALENASMESLLAAGGGLPAACVRAACIGAVCTHAPVYLAGRYIKLSRNLPQSPWILDGKRVLPSSVQEIIYKPLADFYNLEAEEADRRLKLIAAGREDVDVRCLGDGRPFAIEIMDPTRQLSSEELAKACEEISKSGEVIVKQIVPITKEHLVQLKKGEETKSKTYEALCIKLSHSKYEDVPPDSPIIVTPEDIARINSYRNTPQKSKSNGEQKTGNLINLEDGENAIAKLDTPINIPEIESQIGKDTTGDILRTSNVVKSEGVKDMEIDESVNFRDARNLDIKDISESAADTLNIIQEAKNLAKTMDLSDTGDILDTSNEVTESEMLDSPEEVKITIQQKTPIRVLHRRPLLTRTRQILELKAETVPGHPQLFRVAARTSAGTYVKEWAHGELGRSHPALRDVLGAAVDLLALDVCAVHLAWPPSQ